MNDVRFSRKDCWTFAAGFSGEHAAIDVKMKNPAIRMDSAVVEAISIVLDRFDGVMFNQVFELTLLLEGQSFKVETQSSDFIVWKHRFPHVNIRCHLEPDGFNGVTFPSLEF